MTLRDRTKQRKPETPPNPDEVALKAVPPYLRVYLGTRALEVGEALTLAHSALADHEGDIEAHDSKREERRSPDTCPWCADARLVETEIATAERIQCQGIDHDRARGAQLARLADDPEARPGLAEWALQHATQGRSPFAPPPHDPSRVDHHIDRALEAGQRLRKVWPNEKAAKVGKAKIESTPPLTTKRSEATKVRQRKLADEVISLMKKGQKKSEAAKNVAAAHPSVDGNDANATMSVRTVYRALEAFPQGSNTPR